MSIDDPRTPGIDAAGGDARDSAVTSNDRALRNDAVRAIDDPRIRDYKILRQANLRNRAERDAGDDIFVLHQSVSALFSFRLRFARRDRAPPVHYRCFGSWW